MINRFFFTALFAMMSFVVVQAQQESLRDVPGLLQQLAQAKADTTRILLKCKLGEAYRDNNPDTSLMLATQALSQSRDINFKKGEINSLIVLCVLQREKGNLSYALELGLTALKLAEEERLAYQQVYALVRVAVVYFAVSDYQKGIDYLKKADGILKNNYDQYQWIVVQYFLGVANEQLNELDAAEEQVRIVEQKGSMEQDPTWPIVTRRLKANIAVKRNELSKAIEFYRESYNASMADSSFREAATTSNSMAAVFKKLGQTDSVIFYAKQGLKFGQMLSYRNRILAASSLLADLYAEKDPVEAVKYYKIASAAKDSLYGIQKVLQLQSATMKEYERQTEQEAARVAYRNRVKQWSLIGGVSVFVLIALILYRNNRQKQKANKVLEETLKELRATQSQLIQSEKMASLGELTAGIAHEIQNPLNFVNNFSEVNKELLAEMNEEIEKGNLDEVKAISKEVISNEEKVSHHGKRADAIVKGMLQHSRSSSGVKEPTDINALCDEYLRLSYHGLRAKDKSFNADIKTDFDNSIGKINIIPQDIGRVVLNLINNAFYAVDEKREQNLNGYEPTVSVSTKKLNLKVEIRVSDNGNGIPQKVLDKIFQPFFTTKPTGQGTGLGLSLSYDIVTKGHGGELKVETKEGEGTEFIIQLPVSL
jgi:two-component system, NtrC family, sensor kinase